MDISIYAWFFYVQGYIRELAACSVTVQSSASCYGHQAMQNHVPWLDASLLLRYFTDFVVNAKSWAELLPCSSPVINLYFEFVTFYIII